jgi:hypothetical protein
MTRATDLVGGWFASLPLAPVLSRNPRLSNRNKVRIEIAVTYSKQTRGTNSNRN